MAGVDEGYSSRSISRVALAVKVVPFRSDNRIIDKSSANPEFKFVVVSKTPSENSFTIPISRY